MVQISDLGRHLGPVSRKLQKLFGPGKPFFNLYLTRAGGTPRKIWVEVCGPLLRILTLFMNKICDIPHPIYDLTKNSKTHL